MMLRTRVAPQSEVIRAIFLEDSPCLRRHLLFELGVDLVGLGRVPCREQLADLLVPVGRAQLDRVLPT